MEQCKEEQGQNKVQLQSCWQQDTFNKPTVHITFLTK